MLTPAECERPLHHVGCGIGAPVKSNHRAVRGEGSQHDLPSRTAEADAAIGHAETLCCAEVAPLGGGKRGDTSEGEQ
jgi:hypothetical protein